MEIINKKIEELIPYENNPRDNEDAVPYVAESIKEFGFKVPIVIDKNNVIVAGHTRLKAAKQLGLKEVPVIIADDLNEEQINAFRLVDNKVSEFAIWDIKELNEELEDFKDIDISVFGFQEEKNNVLEILDEEGLNKVIEGITEKISVSFTSSIKNIELLKKYINDNSKTQLEQIFYDVIKEEYDESI